MMDSLADTDNPLLPMELPDGIPVEKDDEGLPVFTGEAIFRRSPDRYQMVLAMAAEGNHIRSIARVMGLSKNTVQAILARERASVSMERYRESVSVRLRNSLAQVMDRIDEAMQDDARMKKASARDLAYMMKELAEKMQLFSGGATHRGSDAGEAEHAGDLEHLRRLQAIEGECREEGNHEKGEDQRGVGDVAGA